MTFPKRFLDDQSDADALERAVLLSELDGVPPAGAERQVYARVLATFTPVLPLGAEPAVPVPTAGGDALGLGALATDVGTLGKGFALGVVVCMAGWAGAQLLAEPAPPSESVKRRELVELAGSATPAPRHRDESPRSPPSDVSRADRTAPLGASRLQSVGVASAPRANDGAGTSPAPAASSVASFPAADERALASSRLKEEAALLRRARAELRAGALAAAFATLEASRLTFTAPELSQEREALVIELLFRSGERAAAAARARAFLERSPESPHALAVRAFVDGAR